MKTKLFGCLAATAMTITLATPAQAFHSGGGFHGGPGGGGFRGGLVTGRSVFVPGGNRFASAPFASGHIFVNRLPNSKFHNFAFRHRRFRNFAFFGAPFTYDYAAYGDGCWRQVWTSYGWQWSNICYDYGY